MQQTSILAIWLEKSKVCSVNWIVMHKNSISLVSSFFFIFQCSLTFDVERVMKETAARFLETVTAVLDSFVWHDTA